MSTGLDLRGRLKRRVKSALDRLSGEHSEAAPEARQDYSRPGRPNDDAEVVMARLNRPGAAETKKK
jgi:hypothetical protein